MYVQSQKDYLCYNSGTFSKLLYVSIYACCIFQQNSDYGLLET